MHSKRTRLDRFISQHIGVNRKEVRAMLAQGRVRVDGHPALEIHQLVDEFTHVSLDEKILQAKTPVYLMLNKPIGVVSATKDNQHATVIDVLKQSLPAAGGPKINIDDLHLAGRLDFNTSGLVLLTNDGRWSRSLSSPTERVPKLYRVELADKITEETVQAFAEGMYFPFENITTRPAKLEILSPHSALVTLIEGRYHQIKRMFGRFQNPVIALHRLAVGGIELNLTAGQWRHLTATEVAISQQAPYSD